jgi:hypothetical protein
VAHHALPFPAQRALVLLARAREARPLPAFAGRTAEERRDLVDTFVTGPKASAFKYEGMFIFQNSNESSLAEEYCLFLSESNCKSTVICKTKAIESLTSRKAGCRRIASASQSYLGSVNE